MTTKPQSTTEPKLTMTADELFEMHPLPWSHHLLLIKDANGNQVIHTGGLYNERGRQHEGKYLSGLNALLVELVNTRLSPASAAPVVDVEKQARDLVDAFRFASPPVQSLRFLEWEPLVMAIASALRDAAAATAAPAERSDALRKRARQIIDTVIKSPVVVEVRTFSQPEEVDKLEDQIIALLQRSANEGAR